MSPRKRSRRVAGKDQAPLLQAPIVDQDLAAYAERAYLDYSMYVVRNRALPHISDGLKPVQRRIIYAMYQLGLKASAKPKKSARTIGDVLGKFHPHGDTACYEAMVLMAQSFSVLYPLIEGQGNWGSIDDPKSFAAMRYTEARLSPYAHLLLEEIEQGTVEMQSNFDGTMEEPVNLPAEVPNILLNGSSGIAVGLSTDIPAHNLGEIAQACALILKRKRLKPADLSALVPGPDFPSGCSIICGPEEMRELYRTGSGMLRLRAVYSIEGKDIVFTCLPHQVSISQIMSQLHRLVEAKKLPMVKNIRDESDEDSGLRLVVRTQNASQYSIERCAEHLLASTDLEKNYRVQMTLLGIDNKPMTMGLLEILQQWLGWRLGVVVKRMEWHLDRIERAEKRVRAYLSIFNDLDEIIAIIRASDNPKQALQTRFNFSDFVVEVILETKLRQLARLEEMKLRKELEQFKVERAAYRSYLDDEGKMKGLVRQEILRHAKNFSRPRRSKISLSEAARAMDVRRLTPTFPITVLLTRHGWIRSGRRGEFNLKSVSLKTSDEWVSIFDAHNNENGYCFDQIGRVYRLPLDNLPPVRGAGEPVSKHFKCRAGNLWSGMIGQSNEWVLLCGDSGKGFLCPTEKFGKIARQGRELMRLEGESKMLRPMPIVKREDCPELYLALLTSAGLMAIVPLNQIPERSSGRGVRLIKLSSTTAAPDSKVISCCLLHSNDSLSLIDENQRRKKLSPKDWERFIKARDRKGLVAKVYYQTPAIKIESVTASKGDRLY